MRQSAPSSGAYALSNSAPTGPMVLSCLAEIMDDGTEALLYGVMDRRPSPPRRCLDVGAGLGTVARTLAGLTAPGADVVAVDVDVRQVRMHPRVRVVAADVTEGLPGGGLWDVIHARLVLAHLPQREEVLARLVEGLAPGGVLVVQEWGQHGGSRILDGPDPALADLYRRYVEALMAVFEASGNDGSWCLRVPAAMRAAGLVDVELSAYARTWPGGSAGCRLPIAVSTEAEGALVEQGLAVDELVRLREGLADPGVLLLGNTTWATVGWRRPV